MYCLVPEKPLRLAPKGTSCGAYMELGTMPSVIFFTSPSTMVAIDWQKRKKEQKI